MQHTHTGVCFHFYANIPHSHRTEMCDSMKIASQSYGPVDGHCAVGLTGEQWGANMHLADSIFHVPGISPFKVSAGQQLSPAGSEVCGETQAWRVCLSRHARRHDRGQLCSGWSVRSNTLNALIPSDHVQCVWGVELFSGWCSLRCRCARLTKGASTAKKWCGDLFKMRRHIAGGGRATMILCRCASRLTSIK